MRKLHEPLTLPKHPELLTEINNMKIAIAVHHHVDEKDYNQNISEARSRHPMPSWDEVLQILRKCYSAINEQREDPRKY